MKVSDRSTLVHERDLSSLEVLAAGLVRHDFREDGELGQVVLLGRERSGFRQLGSARQVLLSMLAEGIHFPRPSDGKKLVAFDWTPVRYRNVIAVLKNPFYAGAYAYGKGEKRTEIIDGRARTSYGHRKPLAEWTVLLKAATALKWITIPL